MKRDECAPLQGEGSASARILGTIQGVMSLSTPTFPSSSGQEAIAGVQCVWKAYGNLDKFTRTGSYDTAKNVTSSMFWLHVRVGRIRGASHSYLGVL